jgi:putative endopeptidase
MLSFSGIVRAVALASLVVLCAATAPNSGINVADLDQTCKPCDDFWQFANGGWVKRHPMPAAYARYGAFTALSDSNQDVLHGLLDAAAAAHPAPGSNLQKLGDFYASCMDTAAIDAAGATPLGAQFATIATITDPKALAGPLAKLNSQGVGGFFGYGGGADVHNAQLVILQVRQGGLGLPDRDYYLNDDARSKTTREGYVAHVTQMFALLGDAPDVAAANAQTVLKVETALARNQIARVAQRDPASADHRMTVAQLQVLAPNLDWPAFFAVNGIAHDVPLNVAQPTYMSALSTLLGTLSAAEVRTYLRWQAVHAYANDLGKPFADANFAFFQQTMRGTKEQQPRWKNCVGTTNAVLSDAIGKLYVEKVFPDSAKAQALEMVQTIKQTLRDDFSTLDWMTPQTRERAIAKLDAFGLKIGYPDKWRDYSKLTITRGSYTGNVIAANQLRFADGLSRLGKTPDRMRWGMTAATVNASYSPSNNDITFPAGILQPPFYDKDADMAVNFGGIGAVIGHESTHGFDDEGRKFDGSGNLKDWWTPEDSASFNARADCVVRQYDALSPAPGVQENGKLVEGEAIADLGGVTIAYKAFEKWQSTHPRRTLDGFTPEQRFFLGFAHVWAGDQTPQSIAVMAKTDVHAFEKFRVNATLSNLPEFALAWHCPELTAMVRPAAERCRIW